MRETNLKCSCPSCLPVMSVRVPLDRALLGELLWCAPFRHYIVCCTGLQSLQHLLPVCVCTCSTPCWCNSLRLFCTGAADCSPHTLPWQHTRFPEKWHCIAIVDENGITSRSCHSGSTYVEEVLVFPSVTRRPWQYPHFISPQSQSISICFLMNGVLVGWCPILSTLVAKEYYTRWQCMFDVHALEVDNEHNDSIHAFGLIFSRCQRPDGRIAPSIYSSCFAMLKCIG